MNYFDAVAFHWPPEQITGLSNHDYEKLETSIRSLGKVPINRKKVYKVLIIRENAFVFFKQCESKAYDPAIARWYKIKNLTKRMRPIIMQITKEPLPGLLNIVRINNFYLEQEHSQTLCSCFPDDKHYNSIKYLVDAICSFHVNGLCHGAINPANIAYFPEEKSFKIMNFGVRTMDAHGWEAPEVLQGNEPDIKSDCWSTALIVSSLINGGFASDQGRLIPPFEFIKKHVRTDYRYLVQQEIDEEFSHLIAQPQNNAQYFFFMAWAQKRLRVDPKIRPTLNRS